MKVSFFATCLVDQLFPQVGLASVKVLKKLGVDVEFDSRQSCCGQPAFNSGHLEQARQVAEHFLNVFENSEHVVVPSGSCATMIKKFIPDLFEEGSNCHSRAREVASRTYELSDFIVTVLGVTDTGACFEEKVTFHDSCHQFRELRISEQPRQLIRAVKGIDFVEMNDSSRCCGFGGTFAVKFSDISAAIGNDKIAAILGSGADYVLANDVSCLMHIDGLLKRKGSRVQVMHLAELLVK